MGSSDVAVEFQFSEEVRSFSDVSHEITLATANLISAATAAWMNK